jgi:hypothetical protein
MKALARANRNCKRQTHLLAERMLCKEYDRKGSVEKILVVGFKGLGPHDELIGGKSPVVK